MKKLREFVDRVLSPRPASRPAPSTFGADAERVAQDRDRKRRLSHAIAEEKGRTRRGTF